MKKIIIQPTGPNGKPFTYKSKKILFKGDFIEFVDIYKNKRIIHVSRLLEIVEEDYCESNDTHRCKEGEDYCDED